jgi:hypothetical protein
LEYGSADGDGGGGSGAIGTYVIGSATGSALTGDPTIINIGSNATASVLMSPIMPSVDAGTSRFHGRPEVCHPL